MSSFYLNEWLRGFVDGEGCFQITVRKDRPFTFKFVFKIK
jgi:intein-encoded DNA endonuclease-like protein